jgi:translocation and assembly module TamA
MQMRSLLRIELALCLAAPLAIAGPAGAQEKQPAAVPPQVAQGDTPKPPKRGVVELELAGLDGEQRSAALALLDIAQYTSRERIGSGRLERLLDEAPGEIREALEPFGYYAARARVTRSDLPERRHRVRIEVEPGDPVRVRALSVIVDGPGGDEELVAARLQRFTPAEGEVLDHRVYEAGKASVERALQRLGYFDAELIEHAVEVKRSDASATVRLRWQSGVRYGFGAVSFSGGQFPEPFLARYVPWREGDPYDQAEIENLQQRLAAAGYFGSLEIEPMLEARSDARVPVHIALTPATRSVWNLGGYYETTYGEGLRVGLDRRWVNDRGHSVRGEVEIAKSLTAATAEYRIPRASQHTAQWLIGASAREEDTASVDARSRLLRVGLLGGWSAWTGVASVNALRGSFIVGQRRSRTREQTTVIFGEAGFGRVFARDRIRPRRGGSVRVTARAASESLGSDVDLLQVRGEARYVFPAGEGARLISRLELGWTSTDDFDALPPELRFFAGGTGSVRGYGWQDLGPRDAAGKTVGGERVATASFEYERSFRPDWSWAAFVDGGNVYEGSGREVDFALGLGIGLRWSSPIGPIRLDLAHGLDDPDRSVTLHFSAGPDL